MRKYLITSKELGAGTLETFRSTLHSQFIKYKPEYALYRDKSNPNYDNFAANFIDVCREFKHIKSFIHQNIDLAKELNATGVHLTSTQFDEIIKAKGSGLEIIISTHTHKEVLLAQKLGADAVTYGPIFTSPDKGEPKGVEDLKKILNESKINIFALGGIVAQQHIDLIADTKAYGFASIRYFA